MTRITSLNDLIYPELCYRVVGILFEVHNTLGGNHKEQYYQKAVAEALKKNGLTFQEQVYCPLSYENKQVGKYFFDFLIENKVVLEIKSGNCSRSGTIKQVYGYLKTTGLKLGILARFASSGVHFRRIVNIQN